MRFSRRIGISVAVSRVRPLLDASFLNFRRFVSFGEFVCHRRSKIRCNGNGIVSKNDRSDSVLEDIFVVGQCRPNFLSLGSVVAGSVSPIPVVRFCPPPQAHGSFKPGSVSGRHKMSAACSQQENHSLASEITTLNVSAAQFFRITVRNCWHLKNVLGNRCPQQAALI